MKVCSKCYSISPEDSRFCTYCGTFLPASNTRPIHRQENKTESKPEPESKLELKPELKPEPEPHSEIGAGADSKFNNKIEESINTGINGNPVSVFQSIHPNVNTQPQIMIISQNSSKRSISKTTRRITLLVSAAILVFMLVSSIAAVYFYKNIYLVNKEINTVLGEVEHKNFKEAKEQYDAIQNDSSNSKRNTIIRGIDKKLNSKVEKLTSEYINKNIEYKKVEQWFQGLREFPSIKVGLDKSENKVKKFNTSRENMKSGDKYLKDKEYIEAIQKYKEVIKEDTADYDAAQRQITSCKEKMYDYYLGEADRFGKSKKYEDAYKTIEQIKEYYPQDTKLKAKMDEYLQKLYDAGVKKADNYNTQKKFDLAIKTINDLCDYFPEHKALEDKKAFYEANKLLAIQEEKQRIEKRKKELMAMMNKRDDKNLKAKILAPKGYSTWYVNIDEDINLEPRLVLQTDKNRAILMLFSGFIGEHQVNFDMLVFSVDGQSFEWEVPSKLKHKQVLYDGIGEWSIHDIATPQMLEQLKAIANGKDAKITFQGEKSRNHIITAVEKKNLKIFLELYGYYDNYQLGTAPESGTEFYSM